MRKCLSLLFLFLVSNVFAQENEYVIDAKFNINNRIIDIKQSISFTNNSLNDIDHIILNDWPHSYFNPSSPLGNRLSEDFTLNFQRSTKNQRGYTNIIEIQSENNNLNFERLINNIDLIKVNLNDVLKPKKTIKITIEYQVKIPISDFTGYGIDNDNNINLSEWFITLAKVIDNNWLIESNLDLNDISLDPSFYKFKITYPSQFELISDFEIDSIINKGTYNTLISKKEKRIYNPILITKNKSFKSFKTRNNTVITDIDNIINNKTDSLIFKVVSYVDSKTGKTLEYANISLTNIKWDKIIEGTISDAKGRFNMNKIRTGSYKISVSYLGYELQNVNFELTKKKPDIKLADILLISNNGMLSEVKIKEQKPIFESKIDKIVYNAENDMNEGLNDATDVLRKTPLITVDLEGEVSLRGSKNIKFLVNGKASTFFSSDIATALQMIPADEIKSIEVITSPGAKYDGEGDAALLTL